MSLTNRFVTFITAYLSVGLAGYVFVLGILVLSGVVDIYYEYSFTVIARPVDLVPVPVVVSLLSAVLIVAFLVGVSYYIIKPSWKDVKSYVLTVVREKSFSSTPSHPHDETEASKLKKTSIPQPSDSTSSISPLEARKQELIFSFVCLALASFLGIKIYGVYFASAPHDLGYLITFSPFSPKLPILVVILIGLGLGVSAIYLLKEGLHEFRWLEQTQLAHRLNRPKDQDHQNITDSFSGK